MELVLQADWKTMEGPAGSLVFGVIGVQTLRIFDGCIEEDLVQTAHLCDSMSFLIGSDWLEEELPIDAQEQLDDRMPL